MSTQVFRFTLNLSADKFLTVYQGRARTVSVLAHDGRRIEFSAEKLKPFLTHDGIYGNFVMALTAENRFLSIKRLK
jgi:hypothetical protein